MGGGIRTMQTLERLADAGAERLVLGTKLAADPSFVHVAVWGFGDAIVAGIDARDGMVAVEGWREGTATPASELVAELRELGIRRLVYTDISRDGMQTGINAPAYEGVAATAGFPVVASGGVSTLADIRDLLALGPDHYGPSHNNPWRHTYPVQYDFTNFMHGAISLSNYCCHQSCLLTMVDSNGSSSGLQS